MTYYLKNRTLLNSDIIQPEIPYAEFSPELTEATCKDLVAKLNFGAEVVLAYEEFLQGPKGLMYLTEFLDKLETAYRGLKAGYPIYVFENQQQAKEFFIQNISCSK